MWPGEDPTEKRAIQLLKISVFHFGFSSLHSALYWGEKKLNPFADDSPVGVSIPDVRLPS